MQKSVTFLKKNLKDNLKDKYKYLKDKKYRKVRDNCHYAGEYRGAGHSIYKLKYGVPNKIPIVFYNGSNYDYYFIIKKLAEEFKKQFTCFGENIEKYITFIVPIKKKLQELIKMEIKLQNIYLTCYNLLIAQDLWQVYYQFLSIIFLKEFIELNVNSDTMMKNVKHVELNMSIVTVFLNT